ncbi:NAD(P)-binding protein [Daedalea quercina L-15889]|uniref:NAD(P)-binding protein n=1 Tax=Daedalea quercina L-15889 TaxID=1314783 RepID=A0A165LBA7_9APHY|nr:NAD(P)-binding protein [Daedalea quercina L-15889]
MSAKLSHSSYTVALVGGTGLLGKEVANVFLTSYKPFFSRIIVTARDTTTAGAKALAEKGAELVPISPVDPLGSLTKAFEGVDVVINLVADKPCDFKDAIAEAAIKSGAKVYFPSEFGADHRINDFPGWDDTLWLWKGQHDRKYRQLGAGKTKVIALYTGLFLEFFISPLFGFAADAILTPVGSPDAKTALTSRTDIARALAELTLLSLNPETASSVPDDVRIAGSNTSWRQIIVIVQKVRDELNVEPRGEIKVQGTDLNAFREKLRKEQLEKPQPHPIEHIRALIGEEKLDFSSKNDNELVNPGESIWKWKTVEDLVRERGGKWMTVEEIVIGI